MREKDPADNLFSNALDSIILGMSRAAAWLIALLVVVILFQVVLRYIFNDDCHARPFRKNPGRTCCYGYAHRHPAGNGHHWGFGRAVGPALFAGHA
jgi:hypothetical protein